MMRLFAAIMIAGCVMLSGCATLTGETTATGTAYSSSGYKPNCINGFKHICRAECGHVHKSASALRQCVRTCVEKNTPDCRV